MQSSDLGYFLEINTPLTLDRILQCVMVEKRLFVGDIYMKSQFFNEYSRRLIAQHLTSFLCTCLC